MVADRVFVNKYFNVFCVSLGQVIFGSYAKTQEALASLAHRWALELKRNQAPRNPVGHKIKCRPQD